MNEISFVAWNKATVDDDDEGESQPKLVESKRLAAASESTGGDSLSATESPSSGGGRL